MAWSASNAIVILCVLSLVTPLVTYLMAVLMGHVEPFLPYIGSTGDSPPESTIFTQLIVATTLFTLLTIQIRYVYVDYHFRKQNVHAFFTKMNQFSVWTGYTSCLGLLILGCFQKSNAFYVHYFASIGLFSSGNVVYVTLQTILSCRLNNLNFPLTRLKLVLNFLIIIFTCTYLSGLFTGWKCTNIHRYYLWYQSTCRSHKLNHIIGATSEWLLLWLYVIYVMTHFKDFQTVELTSTKIQVRLESEEPNEEVT